MPNKYLNKLEGKRVLVLGGTSGIGFCVAEASVEYGATVIVSSSRPEKVNKTIERITKSYPDVGNRILGHPCDLASADVEANLKSLFEFATNGGKDKLDHIVNTAGDSLGLIKLEDATPEQMIRMGSVRTIGPVIMAKLSLQYMHKTSGSSLTLTSGVNFTKPSPGWSVMVGSGSGKEGLARGLAVDMKPIRVNCVSPGAIMTELWTSFAGDRLEQVVEMYKAKNASRKVGTPEDMAEAYLFIMKDGFVTGQTVHSEGGYLLV